MSEGGKGKAKLPECSNGQARDQLGKLFGIGGRYVSDAKALSELNGMFGSGFCAFWQLCRFAQMDG
jgi:hypothetical protein